MSDSSADNWELVVENRAAVIAALERGECEGLLPAAEDFPDDFADFCLEIDPLRPPRTASRSPRTPLYSACFFGNLLLYKALLRIPSLQQATRVLFRSRAVLRRRGFNWRQAHEGFCSNGARKSFDEEAGADFFAAFTAEQLGEYQLKVLLSLVNACPELLGAGPLDDRRSLPGADPLLGSGRVRRVPAPGLSGASLFHLPGLRAAGGFRGA